MDFQYNFQWFEISLHLILKNHSVYVQIYVTMSFFQVANNFFMFFYIIEMNF